MSHHPAALVARVVAAVLIAVACIATPTQAMQNGTATIEPPSEVDTQQLGERIADLSVKEEAGDFPPELARELVLLRETQTYLDQGAAALASADRSASSARSAPEQQAQFDTYLATPTSELVAKIDRNLPLDELNAQLEAAKVRRQTETDLRAKVDTDDQYRTTRRAEIPGERGQATERLDALEAILATGANPDDPPAIARARRWHALAEQFAHRSTLRAFDDELRNYDTRRPLLEKRRAYRDRRVAIETQNITALQEVISARQVDLAQAAQREAAQQRSDAAKAHPLVRSILDRNQGITARNTEILGLAGADTSKKTSAEALLAEWRSAYTRSEARVRRVGLTNSIGQHLRNQRTRLPSTTNLRREMADRDEQIGDLVDEAEDLSLLLATLADLDDAVYAQLTAYTSMFPVASQDREELRQAARDALLQQREYLTTLNASINDYLDGTLLDLQNTQRELRSLIEAYAEFIDERILWTRSAGALRPSDLRSTRDAVAWFLNKGAWNAVGTAVWGDVLEHGPIYAMCVPLLLALVLIKPRLRRRLRTVGEKTKRYTSDHFSLTMVALVVTLLMAAAVPAPMYFLAWRLSIAGLGDALGSGLSIGLVHTAELLFAAELIRILCRPGGVGETHFRWKQPNLRIVRHHLRWFVPIVVPLEFVVGMTTPNDNYHDSLGRLAFITMMIAFSIFVQRMLRPSAALVRPFLAQRRGGWLDRLKYVWYPLLVAAPIAVAVIAWFGYFYSAVQLETRVLDTMWLLLIVLVGRAVLLRGLFLAKRRLDIEQRKKKHAAQAEAEADKRAAAEPTAIESTHPIPEMTPQVQSASVPEAEKIDIAAVSAQTRHLLTATTAFTILIGLAVVWLDMLPAFGFIRDVVLWTPESTAIVTAVADDPQAAVDSTGIVQTAANPITLGHIVSLIVILLFTALISKNIPGLLEIVLLQRLPISAGGRYAITTIVRYVLVIVGLGLAFGAIGIGWSKIQWLAAAISVGLGFGLQEIFANFVSGLIILFERPVRVGDTVTVGGITGTVARLRIRATTIVDWDRKELIIPNKEFVTGQIINWTLSDPSLRVVISVGIAYGSDTRLAEQLLLKIAKDDPVVLAEPEPTVVFNNFGESTLDFALRIFIPSIDHLMSTRHRLNNAIDDAFRTAGIVIAFPQRDVHLHHVPAAEPQRTEPDPPKPKRTKPDHTEPDHTER